MLNYASEHTTQTQPNASCFCLKLPSCAFYSFPRVSSFPCKKHPHARTLSNFADCTVGRSHLYCHKIIEHKSNVFREASPSQSRPPLLSLEWASRSNLTVLCKGNITSGVQGIHCYWKQVEALYLDRSHTESLIWTTFLYIKTRKSIKLHCQDSRFRKVINTVGLKKITHLWKSGFLWDLLM